MRRRLTHLLHDAERQRIRVGKLLANDVAAGDEDERGGDKLAGQSLQLQAPSAHSACGWCASITISVRFVSIAPYL